MNQPRTTLERNLGSIVLLALLIGCLLVLRPFVSALLWAIVLSFSCWPIHRRLLRWVHDRRTLAASLMTVFMVIIVLLPFVIVGTTLADNINQMAASAKNWFQNGLPDPPKWLAQIPFVGPRVAEYWQGLSADTARLWAEVSKFIEPVSRWLLRRGLALGGGLLEMALSIFITFFFLRDGATAAQYLRTAVERIGGEQGKHLLEVASRTTRGVVYGILGTALAQAVMTGIGLVIAGVPAPALLTLLTFFASIVPVVGTALVTVPVTLWLLYKGELAWSIFMALWAVGVAVLDHFLRPWLISQENKMSFIVVFLGVFGGAIAFGFIGIFLGPILLAVGYRVLEEWLANRRSPAP